MDDYNDNVTPHPRLLFRKEGFRGNWYTDIEGRDRCGSSSTAGSPARRPRSGLARSLAVHQDQGAVAQRVPALPRRLGVDQTGDAQGNYIIAEAVRS